MADVVWPRWAGFCPTLPGGQGLAGRRVSPAVLVVCVLVALGVAGCAPPRGLVKLETPGVAVWGDDGAPDALALALQRSITYYERLPEDVVFRYGEETYSPREMIGSMELFRTVWRRGAGEEALARELAEKFHLFESVAAEGDNLFTGYYEPELQGSSHPEGRMDTPVYARPPNLVEIDLGLFGNSLPERKLVGRVEDGQVLPFFSRREIQEGKALEGQVEPLAYVNEVDLFFLQIQGSGLVQLEDGRELRVGYDTRNGHPYRSIGALLIRQDIMTREEVSMQTIREYLEQHPESVSAVLYANPSYVFFRLLEEGPLGNIQVPLTPGRSLAADHRLLPQGGLVYVDAEVPLFGDASGARPFRRFMVVQDTGGAIRGHGRGDIFFGRGAVAEWLAGHLKHPGRLFLLVAKKAYLPPATDQPTTTAGGPAEGEAVPATAN